MGGWGFDGRIRDFKETRMNSSRPDDAHINVMKGVMKELHQVGRPNPLRESPNNVAESTRVAKTAFFFFERLMRKHPWPQPWRPAQQRRRR